jgi:hypothetical protein
MKRGKPGGGADSLELASTVARGSGSPELGVPTAPGAKLTWAWVRHDLRDTRDSPRALKERREDSSDEFDGGGGSGRRRIGGARVLGVTGS